MSTPKHPPVSSSDPAAQTSADVLPKHHLRPNVARAWGRVMRAAREAAGLTQEALAQRAQLDRTYPSLLERGRRTPTLPCLFAISRALNVHPSALVADAWIAYRRLESANAPAGCAGAPASRTGASGCTEARPPKERPR